MEPLSLPTEIHLVHPQRALGRVYLDWTPQPGAALDYDGQVYTVLERRHRYHLKAGQYRLDRIAIYVQSSETPPDRHLHEGRWLLGDGSCRFNARSELIRCAVNPAGPCQLCRSYEPVSYEPVPGTSLGHHEH